MNEESDVSRIDRNGFHIGLNPIQAPRLEMAEFRLDRIIQAVFGQSPPGLAECLLESLQDRGLMAADPVVNVQGSQIGGTPRKADKGQGYKPG